MELFVQHIGHFNIYHCGDNYTNSSALYVRTKYVEYPVSFYLMYIECHTHINILKLHYLIYLYNKNDHGLQKPPNLIYHSSNIDKRTAFLYEYITIEDNKDIYNAVILRYMNKIYKIRMYNGLSNMIINFNLYGNVSQVIYDRYDAEYYSRMITVIKKTIKDIPISVDTRINIKGKSYRLF
jgi:hypothetical protein